MKCLAGSRAPSQRFAARALASVSSVVKVFETTMNSVASGSAPASAAGE